MRSTIMQCFGAKLWSTVTRGVTIHEVGIFLYMLGQPSLVCNAQERLQDSGETISRHFHRVLM